MNILADIGHPGHVHLLRHLTEELRQRGHTLFFSVRDIPVAKRLMQQYGMTPWLDLGTKSDTLAGKALTVLRQDKELLRFVMKNRIDLGISSGISLGHVSKLTKMKAMMFDDDDDAVEPLVSRFGHPFTATIFTPECIKRNSPNAVYYPGTHELAYLHPNHFKPDPKVLKHANMHEGERYFIMRFVALNGHHDVGERGLTSEQKLALVRLLERCGRVIISSERTIEPEFDPYRIPVPPEEIHSLMAYSSMFVGDSQTMTSEAAVLGIPALKCNTFAGRLSVPNMLEKKYGLCYAYTPAQFDKMYNQIKQLLARKPENLKNEWQEKRHKLLDESIDPTVFFANYIEKHYGLHS